MDLTANKLPQRASSNNWVIIFDHCFQRVVLDNVFDDCWYNKLDKNSQTPAYKQLDKEQLKQAITIAEDMINNGHSRVKELNNQSLEYRGKN
jgi:hypothetical protein